MRVLITSTSHPHYDKTGSVIKDKYGEGLEIELDGSGEVVFVPEGQFKMIREQKAVSEEK